MLHLRRLVPPARRLLSTHAASVTGVAQDITELIGNTPAIWLNKVVPPGAKIIAKLELHNPSSSVKDRLAAAILQDAEERGEVVPGETVLVEPTSGNTGVALATLAAAKGYRCILTMPESMSLERRVMLLALGAEVVLTPKEKAVQGALDCANKILEGLEGKGKMLNQFANAANVKMHRETTGPEIWGHTGGDVGVFVSGVGTGGTVTGCAEFFKLDKKAPVRVVAVEPEESPVLSGGTHSPHKIQGIGAGLVPPVYDASLIDHVEQVNSDDAIDMARRLAKEEGLCVGISSGAAVVAAIRESQLEQNEGKVIVALIPSYGERYLSTPLFESLVEEAKNLPTMRD